jgi:hypothetical protein
MFETPYQVALEPPSDALDSIISAVIPDEREQPALRAAVLQTNILRTPPKPSDSGSLLLQQERPLCLL